MPPFHGLLQGSEAQFLATSQRTRPSLTTDAIIVPVQVRAIAGISTPNGRRARCPGFRAIAKCAICRAGSIKLVDARRAMIEGGCHCTRRCAVAVVIPGLPVGMAALAVQSAAMGRGNVRCCSHDQGSQQDGRRYTHEDWLVLDSRRVSKARAIARFEVHSTACLARCRYKRRVHTSRGRNVFGVANSCQCMARRKRDRPRFDALVT